MSPALVAQVVALVFIAQGRQPPDGVAHVWSKVLEDLADGPDVVEVATRVVRAQEYVTAGDVHRAVEAERRRQTSMRALPAAADANQLRRECRRCGGTGWMPTTGGKPGYDFVARCDCEPTAVRHATRETTRFWLAKCREQLANAKGPLAAGLKPIVSIPRADQPYFEEPDPVEQWNGGGDPEPEVQP